MCCASTACLSSGATAVRDALQEQIVSAGQAERMRVSLSGCLGPCSRGPMLRVEAEQSDALFPDATPELAQRLVTAYAADPTRHPDEHQLAQDNAFFAKQVRIVTANAGRLDP